ncbi:hypothetical protein QBC43DRAFT_290442 [Cladorrhinum sp. PSN259]|nr:hypothetical protein QBC43DRAFT_290442 [Cladorrhinum sp. PSN259]
MSASTNNSAGHDDSVDEQDRVPQDIRSAVPYEFDGTQDERLAIVQTASYRAFKLYSDFMLINVDYSQFAFIATSLRTLTQVPTPTTGASAANSNKQPGIAGLPNEISMAILQQLDIDSILALRASSRYHRIAVERMWDFQHVTTFAMDALQGIIKTRASRWITLGDIVTLLRTKDCSVCGDFAGIVFLPTLARACFTCLTKPRGPHFNMVRLGEKQHAAAVRRKVGPVTNFVYTLTTPIVDKRHWVTSYPQAGLRLPAPKNSHLAFRPMACVALPYFDPTTGKKPTDGVCCHGCVLAGSQRKPWPYSPEHQRITNKIRKLADRWYTPDDFLEHFRWCNEAQGIWMRQKWGESEGQRVLDDVFRHAAGSH